MFFSDQSHNNIFLKLASVIRKKLAFMTKP